MIKKVEEKVSETKMRRDEHLLGKVEKKRLLFEDKNENEKRIKAMRQTFHYSIMDKLQTKEKKIGEMKRVWLNREQESVDALYGIIHNWRS